MKYFETDSGRALGRVFHDALLADKLPVLFFGAGASVDSGHPTFKQLLEVFNSRRPSGSAQAKDAEDLFLALDQDEVRLAYNLAWSSKEPSYGYHYLAQLFKHGRFPLILTTNWDTLMEQALRGAIEFRKLRVWTRGVSSDETIAKHVAGDPRSTHLVRLHGDERTEIVFARDSLMDFSDGLTKAIADVIRERGIIFFGYAFNEPKVFRIVGNDARVVGVVDPFLSREVLRSLPPEKVHRVTGAEAYFDSFCERLVCDVYQRGLSARSYCEEQVSQRSVVKPMSGPIVSKWVPRFRATAEQARVIDGIIRDVEDHLSIEVLSQSRFDQLCTELFRKLADRFIGSTGPVDCVFLHDHRSPGGMEIHDVIERSPIRDRLGSWRFHILHLIIDERGQRRVGRVEPPVEGCARIVIIDNAAFSGNTLNLVKKHLLGKNPTANFAAGLAIVSPDVASSLSTVHKWVVVHGGTHLGNAIHCPWGVTRPTEPFKGRATKYSQKCKDLKAEDFMAGLSIQWLPKPWGDLLEYPGEGDVSVRVVDINRRERTSLHYHLLRSEVFCVMDDQLRVQLWDRFLLLRKHQSLRIPAGVPHSLIALDHSCRVLEVSSGFVDQKRDITRLRDPYDRPGLNEDCDGLR